MRGRTDSIKCTKHVNCCNMPKYGLGMRRTVNMTASIRLESGWHYYKVVILPVKHGVMVVHTCSLSTQKAEA